MVTYSYLFRSVNSMKLLFIYLIWRASRQLLGSEPQDHRRQNDRGTLQVTTMGFGRTHHH